MAYDRDLVERLRTLLADRTDVEDLGFWVDTALEYNSHRPR